MKPVAFVSPLADAGPDLGTPTRRELYTYI